MKLSPSDGVSEYSPMLLVPRKFESLDNTPPRIGVEPHQVLEDFSREPNEQDVDELTDKDFISFCLTPWDSGERA
eukprot:scaffold689_cov186-Amphora_coffeaeformis.AAC.9